MIFWSNFHLKKPHCTSKFFLFDLGFMSWMLNINHLNIEWFKPAIETLTDEAFSFLVNKTTLLRRYKYKEKIVFMGLIEQLLVDLGAKPTLYHICGLSDIDLDLMPRAPKLHWISLNFELAVTTQAKLMKAVFTVFKKSRFEKNTLKSIEPLSKNSLLISRNSFSHEIFLEIQKKDL